MKSLLIIIVTTLTCCCAIAQTDSALSYHIGAYTFEEAVAAKQAPISNEDINYRKRSLYMNADVSALWGYQGIWEKTTLPGFPALSCTTPLPDSMTPKVCDFVVADHTNQDTTYIALSGHYMARYAAADLPNRKLLWSRNVNDMLGPVVWFNITDTNMIKLSGINDIEVAPDNGARLWVGYDNVHYSESVIDPAIMTNKVGYTPNYGATWYDVSCGLPNIPVKKVLYFEVRKEILYAATDKGVYRCDFSLFNASSGYPYNIRWNYHSKTIPGR